MGFGKGIQLAIRLGIIKPVTKSTPMSVDVSADGMRKSTPMSVDVSAEGMRKKSKTLARGTGVTYSGIRTSSQGLLTGAKTEKKTLLGG
jgi:hypothetical protein